jgi:hypothetical protein
VHDSGGCTRLIVRLPACHDAAHVQGKPQLRKAPVRLRRPVRATV